MRPAIQVVARNPNINNPIDKASSHEGTPKGKRTIITMGEVNGTTENQKAIGLLGSWITLCATTNDNIKGIVMGIMNCCVSASLSTAAPTAANNALYIK